MLFFGSRMKKGEVLGMQHLSGDREVVIFCETLVLARPVGDVSQDRKAEVLKVDADLVGSPGVQQSFHQRRSVEGFQLAKTGPSFPSFSSRDDRHFFSLDRMSRNGAANFTRFFEKFSADDGVINFFHGAFGELFRQ